jgi:hypothetical protein
MRMDRPAVHAYVTSLLDKPLIKDYLTGPAVSISIRDIQPELCKKVF